MEPLRDLPLGFGMALFENETAAQRFAAMNRTEQQTWLRQARAVNSKPEMRALVQKMGGGTNG